MLNLAFALLPSLSPDRRDAEEGFLGKLALWARERVRNRRLARAEPRSHAEARRVIVSGPTEPGGRAGRAGQARVERFSR